MQESGEMTDKEGPDLESRIREHYETLPPAERRLGDLLLDFPGDIATYSATELARMAGTSKAAATRLFRRLGYSDFNAVRRQVRAARRWGSPVYLTGTDTLRSRSRTIAEHLERESANLSRTLESLRPDTVRTAVRALARAPRIFVAGFRNSHVLANYLYRQLTLMRPGVRLVPSAGQTLGEDLVDLAQGDVVVVVALRRRVTAVQKLVEASRARGAHVRCTRLADWTLTCEVRSISPFDSYAAAISVLNLLCAVLFQRELKNGYQRLREIETWHDALEELETYDRFPFEQETGAGEE
jgi:DNA-binding MurR/RpiR family transcriptional regulator